MRSRSSTQKRSPIFRFGLLPCLVQLHTAIASSLPASGDYLQPIRWEDYQAAYTGIQRREIHPHAFRLRDEARFIYGKPGADDSAILANLHVGNPSTPTTQKYIVLEDLDPLLKSISCTDGSINIVFKSTETAKNANDHWVSEIQNSKAHTAIAITNHNGCGSDKDQRHPFLITDVMGFNEDTLTISLRAEELQWAEVLVNSKIEFGQQKLAKPHLFLNRRDAQAEDIDDKIGDFFDDTLNFKNKNSTAETTWDLAAGTQGVRTKLYPSSLFAGTPLDIPNVAVDCTNCYTRGNLGLTGVLIIADYEITSALLALDVLEKVEAVVETNIIANGDLGKFALPQLMLYDSSQMALPVSYTGINIKGILEVGPVISIGLGLEFTLAANINITTGIATGIEKGGQITLDLLSKENTGVKNWNFTWDPSFSAEEVEASITADAFVETNLEFSVKILGGKESKVFNPKSPSRKLGFEFSAGLKMKAPHLSTEFTIGYDGDGFCEGQEAKTGISAEPSVKAGLDFVVSKQKPGDKNATVLYEKPDIFSYEKELPDLCIPFEFSTKKRIELQAKYEAEQLTLNAKKVVEDGKEKAGKVLGKESKAEGSGLRPAGKVYALLAGLTAVCYLLV